MLGIGSFLDKLEVGRNTIGTEIGVVTFRTFFWTVGQSLGSIVKNDPILVFFSDFFVDLFPITLFVLRDFTIFLTTESNQRFFVEGIF